MNVEQVRNKLLVGRSRTCVVDISLCREFPGFVRTVQIEPDWRVSIAFENYGHDEGGVCFWCRFSSLEESIGVVEDYLGLPLSAWPRVAEYPESPGEEGLSEGGTRLKTAIATRQVPLPARGHWTLEGDYWRQFLA